MNNVVQYYDNTVGPVTVTVATPLPVTAVIVGSVSVTQGTTPWVVAGGVASGAANSQAPVKIAGAFNTTAPTFTNGQIGDVQIGARGSINTTLYASNSTQDVSVTVASGDGVNRGAQGQLNTAALGYMLNGAGTADRARSVTNGQNTTGTGVAAVGILGQFDDVSTGIVTENQFAPARIGAQRQQLFTPLGAYAYGATPLTSSSGNVANAPGVATLGNVAGQTTYISGFEVTGSGAVVGLPVTVTVQNTLGGDMSYTYAAIAGVLLSNAPLMVEFNPPIPANGAGTSIVVTCPALGAGNTNNTVVAHGFTIP